MPNQTTAPIIRPQVAYVVLGENGTAWARAITSAASCPVISLDGAEQTMVTRVAAATVPQRATASAPAESKAAAFPVLTCETRIPATTRRAAIGEIDLALPKEETQRIVVVGDTGCRMKRADNAWQSCADENEWPFLAVANSAAAFKPDLVIHVGDYHYRENACVPGASNNASCHGSPWGYGWDTWKADLFEPGMSLLRAAPWIVVRGNHEECRRAGQGWFRFLDPKPFEETRSCNDAGNDDVADYSDPYAIPIGRDAQIILFDSAHAGYSPLNPARPKDAWAFGQYLREFQVVDALAGKPGVTSMFVSHHPVLGYDPDPKKGVRAGHASLLSVMNTLHPARYFPDSVNLAIHGHVHLFEAINYTSNHPATIISGMGGDQVEHNLPDPFPPDTAHVEGVTLESIAHSNEFGFLVMDRQQRDWQIRAFNRHGVLRATCLLSGEKIRCDKTGLLK